MPRGVGAKPPRRGEPMTAGRGATVEELAKRRRGYRQQCTLTNEDPVVAAVEAQVEDAEALVVDLRCAVEILRRIAATDMPLLPWFRRGSKVWAGEFEQQIGRIEPRLEAVLAREKRWEDRWRKDEPDPETLQDV